jgi:energy-coupling factor transporter ATP-binding protein EcfA2
LALLHQAWQQVCQGEQKVVFVTGEAGIGKTTLVDTFIAQLKAREAFWLGQGSVLNTGAREAYLPLLEVLGQVGRGPENASLIEVLRQQAPNWLLQLPALVSDDEIDLLHRRASGTTPERMLRELTEAVETLTARRAIWHSALGSRSSQSGLFGRFINGPMATPCFWSRWLTRWYGKRCSHRA